MKWLGVLLALSCATGCGRVGYAALAVSDHDGGSDASVDALVDSGGSVPDTAMPPPMSCADFPNALVCSAFDDETGFTAYQSNGQVQLVFGVLDAVTVAPGGAAYWVASFPAVTSGTIYFRGHMRIVGDFAISNVNPLMIGDYGPTDFGLDVNLLSGARVEVNPSGGGSPVVSTATLLRDRWICLQGTIVLGNGTGSVRIAADGAQVLSADGMDTLPPGGVRNVSIGIDWTAGDQVNSRIQWEDFVLASSSVGCE